MLARPVKVTGASSSLCTTRVRRNTQVEDNGETEYFPLSPLALIPVWNLHCPRNDEARFLLSPPTNVSPKRQQRRRYRRPRDFTTRHYAVVTRRCKYL